MTLDRLPIGKPARILSVGGAGALRCRLLDMGLTPRTQVVIRKEDAQKIEIEEMRA